MSLALYFDHHVPRAIADGLRRRGIDVLTAQEDRAETLDDDAILDRGTTLGRILFSQDDDLLAIAHERQIAAVAFSGLVYAHQLDITIGQAVRDLEILARVLEPEEMESRVEFLPI